MKVPPLVSVAHARLCGSNTEAGPKQHGCVSYYISIGGLTFEFYIILVLVFFVKNAKLYPQYMEVCELGSDNPDRQSVAVEARNLDFQFPV